MSELRVIIENREILIPFSGELLLSELLTENGLYRKHPCGGRGVCGKCGVRAEGCLRGQLRDGLYLSCRTRVVGDATVWLDKREENYHAEESTLTEFTPGRAMEGEYGCGVDIGTTTVVLTLFELSGCRLIGRASSHNPQSSVAADVMGRIGASMAGKRELLRKQINDEIALLLERACAEAGIKAEDVGPMVITGNTTMLYLLTGRDPTCLSAAPFEMDDSFGRYVEISGRRVLLPRCLHAFVGADTLCAVMSSGMCEQEETSLLCDIGTNGELALWKNGRLYVTSTAAGPAFEGAGISCGCGSISGAVDRVQATEGRLSVHTIDEEPPAGLCGSGLIDAVAAFLELGDIDETGACEEDSLTVAEGVELLPKDIRALQLAKAAVAAGIRTLMQVSGCSFEEIGRLYIAGGFGSHLSIASAVRIGLIPEELEAKAVSIGNAALAGAQELLLDTDRIGLSEELAKLSEHVNLGGNRLFNDNYIDCMMFPEE